MNVIKKYLPLIFLICTSATGYAHSNEVIAPVGETIIKFIELGFLHIIPKGMDHILFVIGLYFLCKNWRSLFLNISAFTIAHSITLALTILGIVSLPGHIVEPIIALSIAVLAIENILFKHPPRWRWAMIFVFGLIHGMGFAGVLSELGLPEGQLWSSLISFNIGVELGQISIILIAVLVTGHFKLNSWYRNRVIIPINCTISLIGLVWFIERVFIA